MRGPTLVLLECGYVHKHPEELPVPNVGDLYLCGKHHYEHRVTDVGRPPSVSAGTA